MKNEFVIAAKRIAEEAGDLLLQFFGKLKNDQIQHKSTFDLVTEADKQSEKLIVDALAKYFPDHSIYGEEFTQKQGTSPYRWFIDPLDGTTNFTHAHPFFAVSMGLMNGNQFEAGVVYAPYLKELFYGSVSEGAYLNNNTIAVSKTTTLTKSLLATGFPYQTADTKHNNLDNFSVLAKKVQGIRRCGAAALDLCYVACGRYDAYWEMWLKPHDLAAGVVIVKEAGGVVTDWYGGDRFLKGRNLIASNGKIHADIQNNLLPFPESEWGQDVN